MAGGGTRAVNLRVRIPLYLSGSDCSNSGISSDIFSMQTYRGFRGLLLPYNSCLVQPSRARVGKAHLSPVPPADSGKIGRFGEVSKRSACGRAVQNGISDWVADGLA